MAKESMKMDEQFSAQIIQAGGEQPKSRHYLIGWAEVVLLVGGLIYGGCELVGAAQETMTLGEGFKAKVAKAPKQGRIGGVLKAQVIRNGKVIQGPKGYSDRRQVMGANSTGNIAAGAQGIITVRPQRAFKVKRFMVASAIAAFFDINDIKVGQTSQLVSANAMPAQIFTEGSMDAYVDWDTASIGNEITITVTNVDGAAHAFRAGLLGTAAIAQF